MLNKNGWGLQEMLILSGILILFLGIAIYFIYGMYNSLGEEATVGQYKRLEESLENQASIYLSDYFNEALTSTNLIITRNILRSYNLDITLTDTNNNPCSGYVIANKVMGKTNIKGYIRCVNYQTEGYEEFN